MWDAMNPEAPEAWMARAEINDHAGNEDAALADAAAAIRIHPNFAPAYLLRLNLFRKRNQSELALAEASRARSSQALARALAATCEGSPLRVSDSARVAA